MTSSLETLRQCLEDLENLESAGAIAFNEQAKCGDKRKRRRILWDNRVKRATVHMQTLARRALDIIEDKDQLRTAEIATLSARSAISTTTVGRSGHETASHSRNGNASMSDDIGSSSTPPPVNALSSNVNQAAPSGIGGRGQSGSTGSSSSAAAVSGNRDLWKTFYDRLKSIQDYYKKWGAQNQYPENRDANFFVCEIIEELPELSSVFSDGEMKGKVMDLSAVYEAFVNWKAYRNHRELEHRRTTIARMKKLKFEKERKKKPSAKTAAVAKGSTSVAENTASGENAGSIGPQNTSAQQPALTMDDITIDLEDSDVRRKLEFHEVDYVRFLRICLSDFKSVPRHCKYRNESYDNYLRVLLNYLQEFYAKIRPLSAASKMRLAEKEKFENLWTEKTFGHWIPPTCEMEKLFAPATDRVFATEGACQGHMQSKKYKRVAASITPEAQAKIIADSKEHDKELAKREYLCSRLLEILTPYIEVTVQFVRKKQSRSAAELAVEAADSEDEGTGLEAFLNSGKGASAAGPGGDGTAGSDNSDDDEDGISGGNSKKVRNPLNLPLGWDGKPIPYWLYKLHGLGQEFKCEICGNQSYWGRRVFERHFQEWRHAFGMRCLKIPNTVHFKEITKIQDVLALYEKLKTETEQKSFLADQEVEVEDAHGNVMTPQTYEDLRKQGLL